MWGQTRCTEGACCVPPQPSPELPTDFRLRPLTALCAVVSEPVLVKAHVPCRPCFLQGHLLPLLNQVAGPCCAAKGVSVGRAVRHVFCAADFTGQPQCPGEVGVYFCPP